jgi:CelD/BcsL family acetyltransferase involved in cellulose biosynthesis
MTASKHLASGSGANGVLWAPPAQAGVVAADPPVLPPAEVLVHEAGAAERLREDWVGLLARCERPELMLTPDWLLTWWDVYGSQQGRQLRLGLFYEDNRLIGLTPLVRRWHTYLPGLPFRRLEFLASGEREGHGIWSNHLNVLAERGHEEAVARRLVAKLHDGLFGSWDEVVLPMMDADSPMTAALTAALRRADLAVTVEETGGAPYIPLPDTWDEYLKSLSGSHRHLLTRSLRAFDQWAEGQARLERVVNRADLERGKRILVSLHHARWAKEGQRGVFRSPSYLRFHDQIMERLLERGRLELCWLSVRGEPVAVLYAMVWEGKVYAYQLGRNPDLPSKLRLGSVLMAHAIRAAIEAGRYELDFLADESLFKSQLALATRRLVRLRAVRPGLREQARQLVAWGLRGLRCLRRTGRAALESFRRVRVKPEA